MTLLVIMINAIITFQKLHYGAEYMLGGIVLTFLLFVRLMLGLKSKAKQTVKNVKQNVE